MENVYLVNGIDEVFIGTVEQLQVLVGPERSKSMGMEEREIIVRSIVGIITDVLEEVLYDDEETDARITLEIR